MSTKWSNGVVCYFIVPCGKFGSLYLGNVQEQQEQRALPAVVCSMFVSKQGHGDQCLVLLTPAQMLMHAVHTGAVRTPGESALEVNSRRKIPCRTGDSMMMK